VSPDRHPLIAREGWVHVALVVAAAVLVHITLGGWWAAPFWAAAIFVLQFFRDPTRLVPDDPTAIICPADGRVVAVGDIEDPYLKRPAKRVSVFMNVFNVHSNRSPIAGKVMERWYAPGAFLNAALDKASSENERNALWIRTEVGVDIVVVQVAGLIARRILCYVQPGDPVGQGQRYGFIRFGSRVDVYFPPDCRINVALGDRVKAGRDTIAYLTH